MVVWSPFRFNSGREMANRFAIAPLTTDSSHEDGTATENELEFVRRRAASGFGATISSAAYVEQDGRSWQGIGATHEGHLSTVQDGMTIGWDVDIPVDDGVVLKWFPLSASVSGGLLFAVSMVATQVSLTLQAIVQPATSWMRPQGQSRGTRRLNSGATSRHAIAAGSL
jgi:NADH:flavin oxidoreductase / NADH oxidase family